MWIVQLGAQILTWTAPQDVRYATQAHMLVWVARYVKTVSQGWSVWSGDNTWQLLFGGTINNSSPYPFHGRYPGGSYLRRVNLTTSSDAEEENS